MTKRNWRVYAKIGYWSPSGNKYQKLRYTDKRKHTQPEKNKSDDALHKFPGKGDSKPL